MKLSNVIAFTQYMQALVAESDIFTRCVFTADDVAACLRISVKYREPYANGGVSMCGNIMEEVSYEEFNKTDFDPMKLGIRVLSKLNDIYMISVM